MSKKTTALVTSVKGARDLLARLEVRLERLLPSAIAPDRMAQVTMLALARNPKLYECTTLSLAQAVLECATLGLVPDGVMGSAYLVPFYNSRSEVTEAKMIPGYRGYVQLASRCNVNMTAFPVFERDEFSYRYGLAPDLVHVPHRHADRGKLTAAYCVARWRDRAPEFLVMEGHEIEVIKAKSKGAKKSDSPWNSPTDEPEMWRKTPVRKMAKYLDLSPEFNRAVALDDAAEERAPAFTIPEVEVESEEIKEDLESGETGQRDALDDVADANDAPETCICSAKLEEDGIGRLFCSECGWSPDQGEPPHPAEAGR